MRTSRPVERENAANPREVQRRELSANPSAVEHVLALQRLAGNAAVGRLLRAGHERTVRRLQRDDQERDAELAYYESTRQVRLEAAAKLNDEWWRANLSGGDASQIDAFWRGGRKAALIQAISTPDHGLGARQVLRIWTLYWADEFNLLNNFVDNMGGCAKSVPDDKCSEYQRRFSQAASMLSAVVDVFDILQAAEQLHKSLTLDQINEHASQALRFRAIVGLLAAVAGGLRQSPRAQPLGRPSSRVFEDEESTTTSPPEPVRQPSTVTPKTPPPPPRTLTNATTTDVAELKDDGFVLNRITPNGRTAVYQNPTTGARAEVTLRQGGPTWANPAWGRGRLESELRDRGFILDRQTRGEGGLLYRNSSTGEEVRIMPKPGQQFRDEPIEKHLASSYYRYRPNGNVEWGDHTMLPDKTDKK